ncbi:MAG: O-antigen ligase family protein, partial [Candidatus Hydrogenedentes bacterium]|nr:O-antigen ligase family protein [Candidatus Hydrogenedentota bacterium]
MKNKVLSSCLFNRDSVGRGHLVTLSVMALAMGCAMVACTALPPRYAVVGMAAVLAPFTALSFGKWKPFFLTALILGIPIQVKKTFYGYSLTHIGGPGGADLMLADCALAALLAQGMIMSEVGIDHRAVWISWYDMVAVAFVLVSAMSLFNSTDTTLTYVDLGRMVKVLLIYFYLANNVRTHKECKYILFLLLAGVFVHCAVTVVQYKLGRTLGLYLFGEMRQLGAMRFGSSMFHRPSGLMQSANTSALYLVSVLPLSIIPMFWLKKPALKAMSLAVFVVGLFTLIVTFSRGGWVGFACAVPVFIWFGVRADLIRFQYRRHFHIAAGTAVAGAVMLLLMSRKIIDRVFHSTSVPLYTRSFLTKLAIRQFSTHPFIGVGLNTFAESSEKMVRSVPDPHNIFSLVSDNPIVHN